MHFPTTEHCLLTNQVAGCICFRQHFGFDFVNSSSVVDVAVVTGSNYVSLAGLELSI